jgi:phage gp36-like protein
VTYATQQDLIDRFGEDELIQLTDRDIPPSGEIDATAVARALADTDGRIDGFLASRYPLPLSSVPAEINRLACDIARYFLARLPTDEMRKRYDDATAWLTNVAKGQFSLGLDANQQETPSSPSVVVSQRPHRVFDDCNLDGFIGPGRRR